MKLLKCDARHPRSTPSSSAILLLVICHSSPVTVRCAEPLAKGIQDNSFFVAFNCPNDLQIVVAAAAPIGLTSDSPDWGLFFYLSFEHPFARVAADTK